MMAAAPGGVEVGRVSVRVVPDTSRMLAELDAELAKIEARTELRVNATIDNTRLDAEARAAVEQAQLAAGNIHVDVEVDTSQVREAETAFASATSSASGFSSGLSGILAVAVILGPALIPVIAAVTALGAALVAPLAIVGGGLTVFGFMAGFTIIETQKQLKAISTAQMKLDGLTKGTKEYAAAAADLKAKQAALTPAQKAYATALTGVTAAFDKIPKTIVLTPITDGLKLLAHVLPLVEPVLRVVSGVITDIIGQFDKAARSQGFKDFVTAFAKQLGPDLRAFASIAGNVFKGLFGLFGAFGKQLGGSVLKSLENLTGKFATWGQTLGQSKGFKSFVDYVKRVGPQVADALGSIVLAAIAIATAFAPVGGVVLTAVKGLADAIRSIPPRTLATLATALVALVVGAKLLGPVIQVFELIATIAGGGEVAAVVLAVVALAAGFVALYANSKPLRRLIGDLADYFKTKLLPQIKDAAKKVFPALKQAFHDISESIRKNRPFLETLGELLLALGSAQVIASIYGLVAAIKLIGKAAALQITIWHILADAILGMLLVVVGGLTLFVKAVFAAFGQIVDGAASAFGWLPGIGDKVKNAQAAFHSFADNVVNDLAKTSAKLKALQDQIDALHGKTLTITVIAKEQGLDRAVGPGGGIGRPGQGSGAASGSSSRSGGTTVNVQNMVTTSTSDIVRKSQTLARGRAGGNVVIAGSNG